jgi:hypothetical protein
MEVVFFIMVVGCVSPDIGGKHKLATTVPTFEGSFFSAFGYVAARSPYEQIRLISRALPKIKTLLPATIAQK